MMVILELNTSKHSIYWIGLVVFEWVCLGYGGFAMVKSIMTPPWHGESHCFAKPRSKINQKDSRPLPGRQRWSSSRRRKNMILHH